jgi:hypothetical protein
MQRSTKAKLLTGLATASLAVASLFTAQQREPSTILSKDANIQYTYTDEQGKQVYGVLDDESMDSIAMAKTKNTMVVKTSAFIAYGEEPPDNPTYLPVIVRKVSTNWPANHSRTGYWRPAPGGVSIGHPKITAGTLGGQVCYKGNCNCFITNAHVAGGLNGGKIGDPIYQPGPHDGGKAGDEIAKIVVVVTPKNGVTNTVDAAIACGSESTIYPEIYGIGDVNGVYENLYIGMPGVKCGRTTGCTILILTAKDVTAKIGYVVNGKLKFITFAHQLLWEGVCAGGDSGSMIITDHMLDALLFAGNDNNQVMSNDPVYLLKALPGLVP